MPSARNHLATINLLGGGFGSLSALETILKHAGQSHLQGFLAKRNALSQGEQRNGVSSGTHKRAPPPAPQLDINLITPTKYYEYTPAILTTLHNSNLYTNYHVDWNILVKHLLERHLAHHPNAHAQDASHIQVNVNLIHGLCTNLNPQNQHMDIQMLEDEQGTLEVETIRSQQGEHFVEDQEHPLDALRARRNAKDSSTTNDIKDDDDTQHIVLPYDFSIVSTGGRYPHSFIRYSPYLHHVEPSQDFSLRHYNRHDLYVSNQCMTTEMRIRRMDHFRSLVKQAKHILVIGGGGVGTEMAAELVHAISSSKQKVTLAHSHDALLNGFPADASQYAMDFFHKHNVHVITNARLKEVSQPKDDSPFFLYQTEDRSQSVEADLVIHTAGMTPDTDFVPHELLDKRGHMLVNEHMQSLKYPNLFAAGDMTAYDSNALKKLPFEWKKATSANNQAKTAALNILHLMEDGPNCELKTHKPKKFSYNVSLGNWDGFIVNSKGIKSSGLMTALKRRLKFSRRIRMKMGEPLLYPYEKALMVVIPVALFMSLVLLVRRIFFGEAERDVNDAEQ